MSPSCRRKQIFLINMNRIITIHRRKYNNLEKSYKIENYKMNLYCNSNNRSKKQSSIINKNKLAKMILFISLILNQKNMKKSLIRTKFSQKNIKKRLMILQVKCNSYKHIYKKRSSKINIVLTAQQILRENMKKHFMKLSS